MIMMCDLPPPLHGMSQVNLFMRDLMLTDRNVSVRLLSTAPNYAHFIKGDVALSFVRFVHRLLCVPWLILMLTVDRSPVAYRAINGGKGQVYDILYLLIFRLFQRQVFIHHHSYAYLTRRSNVFSFLIFLSGTRVKHIVLAESMKNRLSELYSIDSESIFVISNLSFFTESRDVLLRQAKKLTLGHLANLSLEKGVGAFIDLCRELRNEGVSFEAVVAGPFSDDSTRKIVLKAESEIPEITYLGPIYSEAKGDFFSKIDVFVFPSQYSNEAEPLVLYEAAQYGVCLAGTQVGCLKEVISSFDGFSFENTSLLIHGLAKAILSGEISSDRRYKIVQRKCDHFNSMLAQVVAKRDRVIQLMVNLDR